MHLFSFHGSIPCSWTLNVPQIDPVSSSEKKKRGDNETIQETDIMLISKLAPLPIRRQRFHPPFDGMLNTITTGGFIAILVSTR